ncbi:MAG TPA: hypothetical protein VKG91_05640 [Roseiarcus sp.]|nr:hypothetical protein [Roseiarcus sp.]
MVVMAGLVPAIHAALPQRRVWYWCGPPQRPTNARFFASSGCLAALDAPNHVDGLDKPGHDALKDPPANLAISAINNFVTFRKIAP